MVCIWKKTACAASVVLKKLKGTDRTLELLNKIHQMGYKYHLYLIGTGDIG